MAMKKKISKAEYDKLSDALKSEYMADGDNYKLDLSDDEDVGPIRRALEREKADANTSKARVKELEEKLAEMDGNDARKNKDIDKLEASWKKKHDDAVAEVTGKLTKSQEFIKSQLVDNVASQIAHKISKSPALILPHIKARLLADFDGDTPVTKVLDKDGKPSAMTAEQLSAEFVANKDFSAIIIASQASGGAGASNAKGGGGGAVNTGNNSGNQPADLSTMSPRALADRLKEAKAQQDA